MEPKKKLTELFLSGNLTESWKNIMEIKENERKSSHEIYQLLTETMEFVSEMWEENQITAAEEQIASYICKSILNNYSLKYIHNVHIASNKAMFLCLGEKQDIGTYILSNMFKEGGWSSRVLEVDMTIDYIVGYSLEWRPHLIWLSISNVYHLHKLKKYSEELIKLHSPKILVGGNLANNYELERYTAPGVIIIRNLKQAIEWINQTGTETNGIALTNREI
ncbi:cobalamin B12-binding domain-containing protein [Metabacillus arenae]|uniref:B12-binding domain-containing protein n=1 Tax=Metabacillus arenae TaxID=2771434 RepID=A0A926NHF9_9BACI|nr:cobalamin B12-binding domain-containing protein [Metabacillus arenae]MBD1381130.1 hypothetical protein [Metabacillus arenae]